MVRSSTFKLSNRQNMLHDGRPITGQQKSFDNNKGSGESLPKKLSKSKAHQKPISSPATDLLNRIKAMASGRVGQLDTTCTSRDEAAAKVDKSERTTKSKEFCNRSAQQQQQMKPFELNTFTKHLRQRWLNVLKIHPSYCLKSIEIKVKQQQAMKNVKVEEDNMAEEWYIAPFDWYTDCVENEKQRRSETIRRSNENITTTENIERQRWLNVLKTDPKYCLNKIEERAKERALNKLVNADDPQLSEDIVPFDWYADCVENEKNHQNSYEHQPVATTIDERTANRRRRRRNLANNKRTAAARMH